MRSSPFVLAVMLPIMALAAPIPTHTPAILPRNSEIHLGRSIRDIFNDKLINLPDYAVAPKEDATLFGGVEESHADTTTQGKRSDSSSIHTTLQILDVVGEDRDTGLLLQRLIDSASSQSLYLLAMRLVIVLLSIAIVGELWNLWRLRQMSIQRDEIICRGWTSTSLSTIDEKEEELA